MGREKEYILTTEPAEIERLRLQHHAWIEQAYALFARAGLCAGQAVLDLGCGPGFTSFELATVVGPRGRVIARDESARFLEGLAAERDRRGLGWIEPSLGRVEDLELPPESLDAAYARWLFCWLAEPEVVLARVARALKPGGAVLLQEYLDWGRMKLLPRSRIFELGVEACMESWRQGGGTIDFGTLVPTLAAACSLEVEHFAPVARIGAVGSLEWRWIGGFFASYLPKLVERGEFSAADLDAWNVEWARRERAGEGYCYAPTMVDGVLRKPR
jgi:SAM-dependent methyltransferase